MWCEGDPFVELEPAEDIEHIELFLEPKDELFEGLEGGVWKVNPSDFMSLITCSDTVGNLKGSWKNKAKKKWNIEVSENITFTSIYRWAKKKFDMIELFRYG